ncbi:MAG: peroxiredoxin [Chloroflexota bacterium]
MTQPHAAIPRPGDPAPDFTLQNTDLEKVSLRDSRGRPVVLVFFPAAFTGTCTAELCAFRDSMGRLNQAHAQVFGISTDLPFSLKQFKQTQGLQFPLLSDYDHEAINAYGVTFTNFHEYRTDVARRSVFVIDPDGEIVWEWLSDHPGQEPDYDQVLAAIER